MSTPAVALATCGRFPDLAQDDRLLLDALGRRGLSAGPAVWNDSEYDWPSTQLCVVRSTWDNIHALPESLAWAEHVSQVSTLRNTIEVIRWNTHKTYLRDLESRGVPVVPTVWLQAGSSALLADILSERGWAKVVVKPAVSADAFGTLIVNGGNVEEGQMHLQSLIVTADMMVQPYMASVETHGERSLMFILGEFTHAVRRPAVLTGEAYGEQGVALVQPAQDELGLASHALAATGFDTLYARVDLVRDDAGKPRLMELELVEPSLFLDQSPAAVEKLADAITGLLK